MIPKPTKLIKFIINGKVYIKVKFGVKQNKRFVTSKSEIVQEKLKSPDKDISFDFDHIGKPRIIVAEMVNVSKGPILIIKNTLTQYGDVELVKYIKVGK
jgi:hypothetical protein